MRAVKFNGYGTNYPQIVLGNGASDVIRGITQADVEDGSSDFITCLGILTDLDTSSFSPGVNLYAGANGVLQTSEKPLGDGYL